MQVVTLVTRPPNAPFLKRKIMTIERWIVQEWSEEYETWTSWFSHGGGSEWRFWSYHNARKDYEEYKKEFHYTPRMYRYCKIVIRPEKVINTAIHSTISLNGEEINLTQTTGQKEMKFT